MHPISLFTVKEVDLAIRAHARDPDTAFIAGGTDLVGLMKDRVVLPLHLVDINHLPGLDQIEVLPDGGFRMGALVRMTKNLSVVSALGKYWEQSLRIPLPGA